MANEPLTYRQMLRNASEAHRKLVEECFGFAQGLAREKGDTTARAINSFVKSYAQTAIQTMAKGMGEFAASQFILGGVVDILLEITKDDSSLDEVFDPSSTGEEDQSVRDSIDEVTGEVERE